MATQVRKSHPCGHFVEAVEAGHQEPAPDEELKRRPVGGRVVGSRCIEELAKGLETHVGERGASLSFGQRQLVCFARAMLANPRIVVLDEATSAIDTVTEARLQKALELLLKGRTAFVVAHRLSTIRKASLVLVLDSGRIIERGTHESLLEQDGAYASLHRELSAGGASKQDGDYSPSAGS